MELVFPDWLSDLLDGKEECFITNEETTVGVSGGKTSGLLAFLMDYFKLRNDLIFTFQNTGREHEKTYEFLNNLSKSINTKLVWMEFRKPLGYGDAPKESGTEIVNFTNADRSGKPFSDLLETLAEYRKVVKNYPPVAPNATMRLCTAYLKFKVWERYVNQSLGWEVYTHALGLRADEPDRVARMTQGDTRFRTTIAPLANAGVTKEHVNRFWSEQPFTLEIPENLGNCTLCFLKDEADLAWNMIMECSPEEVDWWIGLEEKYGQFKNTRDYRTLFEQAPFRLKIRDALTRGEEPPVITDDWKWGDYQYKLLVRQERRVQKEGLVRIPCSCEGSRMITDEVVADA